MALREAHPLERAVGVGYYVSEVDGTGGRLRSRPADFRVREIERFAVEPLAADPDAYPHLVVRATLENWETNQFASALSDRLAMSRERVSWAGTKDKRAVTTQLVSLHGPEFGPADLPELRGAELTAVGRAGRALEFGDLAGNAFEIVVSDAERPGAAAAVTEQLAAVAAGDGVPAGGADGASERQGATTSPVEPTTETVAVPNYFGQQRFGSRRAITHEVGFALLRGDWPGAVLAYCGAPSDREPADSRAARGTVEAEAEREDPDWAAALAAMPDRLGHERAMLGALADRDAPGPSGAGGDGRTAFDSGGEDDPFRAALETTPTSLQRLFVNAAQSAIFNRIVTERLRRGLPLTRPVAGDVVCFAETVEAGTGAPGTGSDSGDRTLPVPDTDRLQRVDEHRLATVRRHCDRGRAFVTAPLVGTETAFGDGEPGEIERAVCADAGIEPADFELPGRFHSAGTRRAVAVRTDLDVAPVADREDAYELAFALPSGSYATVVLREYLKVDPDDL